MDQLFLDACEENGISFCAKYIRKQLDLNVRDANGCSGIMKACLHGNYDLVKLLVENGAEINQVDRYNQNVLHYAVQSNNQKLVKFLLSKKLNSKEQTNITGLQPKSYTNRAVPLALVKNTGPCGVGLKHDPLANGYLEASRNIKDSETYNIFMERNEPQYSEDKIYNMILRYEDMDLSDCESDADICESGEQKQKKSKSKGKGKAKAKAPGKGKKKKGKGKKK